MAPRSQEFPQRMSKRPDISTRAHPGPEPRLFAIPVQNLELFNLDRLGFEFDRLFLAREFISWNAGDLFCRERRRNLLDLTDKGASGVLDLLLGQVNRLFL